MTRPLVVDVTTNQRVLARRVVEIARPVPPDGWENFVTGQPKEIRDDLLAQAESIVDEDGRLALLEALDELRYGSDDEQRARYHALRAKWCTVLEIAEADFETEIDRRVAELDEPTGRMMERVAMVDQKLAWSKYRTLLLARRRREG